MWRTGKGILPKNDFNESQIRTLLSFPIDHGIAMFLKERKASRKR